jgi:NCAIR mutase (PurE)-related protein
MNQADLRTLLEQVRDGSVAVDDGLESLARLPVRPLGHSRIDTHREMRCGFPEVVWGADKSAEQIVEIARALLSDHGRVLVTRVEESVAEVVRNALPELEWDREARALFATGARGSVLNGGGGSAGEGLVLVLSAGTADGPVAAEAALTARMLGARVEELRDVGVAGLHRLLAHEERLREARALVVVAGMEGALPSVVGGLVARPVIAVPTSVGYGAALGGLAALLGMLNTCAAGVTVVNIDNGFGAGYAAALINRTATAVPAETSPQ